MLFINCVDFFRATVESLRHETISLDVAARIGNQNSCRPGNGAGVSTYLIPISRHKRPTLNELQARHILWCDRRCSELPTAPVLRVYPGQWKTGVDCCVSIGINWKRRRPMSKFITDGIGLGAICAGAVLVGVGILAVAVIFTFAAVIASPFLIGYGH